MSTNFLPSLANHAALGALRLMGFSRRFVPTSGGRIHVIESDGRGHLPPVVLLHGFSSSGTHYQGILRRLRPRVRRLICPDMPGHGFSDTPADGMHPRRLHDGLFEALDRVVDSPSVLFGTSMGGYAALEYARARPERVLGVVACSPAGAPMTELELARLMRRFRIGTHQQALDFVDDLLHRPSMLRPLLAHGIRQSFSRPEMRELASRFGAARLLEPEDIAALTMPLLLAWGRSERILPDSGLAFFKRHLPPHAHIVEPGHFGHSAFLEDPDAVTHLILRLAEEAARTPRILDRRIRAAG